MSVFRPSALLGALAAVAALLTNSPAYSHAVCGDRVFPATLGIDDPGVGDELALPTVAYLSGSDDGASGHGAGVVGELHYYFDDIFPNSLGKPIFGGKS